MKVKQLKKTLEILDDNATVLLAKDPPVTLAEKRVSSLVWYSEKETQIVHDKYGTETIENVVVFYPSI